VIIEVGKKYKTYGGWEALIIWRREQVDPKTGNKIYGYYVVHKPNTAEESVPIGHDNFGRVGSIFAINEPPVYGEQHPADLKELVK